MSITITSKTFGELQIPKEGFDKQSLLEKYLDGIRAVSKEYQSEDGSTVFLDKHNRIIVKNAILVGWLDAFNIEEESPKKIAWLAKGVSDYVVDCTTVDPN
jgi:hypothetical protein